MSQQLRKGVYYRIDAEGAVEIKGNDVAREVRIACTLAQMSQGEFAQSGQVDVNSSRGNYRIKREDTLTEHEQIVVGLISVVELPALAEAPAEETAEELQARLEARGDSNQEVEPSPSGEPVFDAVAAERDAREALFGNDPSGVKGPDELG